MSAPILVAGLDSRSLLLEAPVLLRDQAVLAERASARELLEGLAREGGRLVVLGPHLPDLTLPEAVRRIRSLPATRRVSGAFWLLPILLGWVGGLLAWVLVRDRDRSMARNMLITGVVLSVFFAILYSVARKG